jgi:hypothetical protein
MVKLGFRAIRYSLRIYEGLITAVEVDEPQHGH